MISTRDVLTEFVFDLSNRHEDKFIIDAVNENGVAFYYRGRGELKFSLVIAPMFGVEEGYLGLVVTKYTYPKKDSCFKLEDPDLLLKLENRIKTWLDMPYTRLRSLYGE